MGATSAKKLAFTLYFFKACLALGITYELLLITKYPPIFPER